MPSTARSNRAPWSDDDQRYAALVARDKAADGHFFYSVETTGVYCRPSCGARLARRENIRFHATVEAAERAGFRRCKRCRPAELPLEARHAQLVAEACRQIARSDTPPTMAALARAAGLSRFHFQRVFKSLTGLTPRAYALAQRAERMREELRKGSSVTAAIYGAGYGSNGRFYESADAVLGMTATRFRAGGERTQIRFAVADCSLGAVLVAATERGTCCVLLGDEPDALVRELQDRFPRAELLGGDGAFEQLVARVVGLVEAPKLGLELPLDLRGTAFQQRVWQALRAIPAGSTTTYSELARAIGMPNAVRAVASACAANPLAVLVPCHRVVRRDGELAGYRWGVERKRALLAREAGKQGASSA